jgi:type IV pilus assembly protein PilA
MLYRLRQRSKDEGGFTLVELLVVILIIGILAAIAIPSFLRQKSKANDASAKELARTAQTTMETAATDNGGSYALMTEPAKLKELEKTIPTEAGGNAYLSEALGSATGYKVVAKASASSGDTFTIENAGGVITRSCTTAGNGGCPAGGKW